MGSPAFDDSRMLDLMSGMLAEEEADAAQALQHRAAADRAMREGFLPWVTTGGFTADREPVDFDEWSFLKPIYESVPFNPTRLDFTIMKAAQCGASIFALLLSLWLALRSRCSVGYFLPTKDHAMIFSTNRFIRLVRENAEIHRMMGDPLSPHKRRITDEGSASVRRLFWSTIYFTYMGGKVTTEALPLDALLFDEVQEMLDADMEKAEMRITASPLKAIARVSTANFEGADIHRCFQASDQRWFHTKCKCPDGVILAEQWHPRHGPLCIDRGNGSRKSVPREWFYLCPKCKTQLPNPRLGAYRARLPENAPTIGYQFPQMLSPRQEPGDIIKKWETRVDTKNFYNRILGYPYSDPDTVPVTLDILQRSVDTSLSWGVPGRRTLDGVFMGVDQMGHDNHVVIAGRAGDRIRLLHLEIIQASNPWVRTAELMRKYRVRFCGVEANPNYNQAHEFAKKFDGRVFVASYQEQVGEMLTWGDRARDRVQHRQSAEEIKTRYTVSIDQYKMMQWALYRWVDGHVVTPDARALTQRVRTGKGWEQVMLCKDVFWLHLQRVALVVEEIEGAAGTKGKGKGGANARKLRRAVKKIAIDPHYAFSWMLLCVAFVRAYGTELMLSVDDDWKDTETASVEEVVKMTGKQKAKRAEVQQIHAAMPEKFEKVTDIMAAEDDAEPLCANCENFDAPEGADKGKCSARNLWVEAKMPACPHWIPADDEAAADEYDDEGGPDD